MPLPRVVGRFNRVVTNRITGLVAGRVPPFAIVSHTGRKFGTRYRTPVNAFRTPEGFVIALTYGRNVDWLRNVLAVGGVTLEHRGKRMVITNPRLTGPDTAHRWIPAPIRLILRLLNVDDFISVRVQR